MQVSADPELHLLREELHHHLPRPHRRAERHVQEAGVTCQERRLGQIILVILLDLDKYTKMPLFLRILLIECCRVSVLLHSLLNVAP